MYSQYVYGITEPRSRLVQQLCACEPQTLWCKPSEIAVASLTKSIIFIQFYKLGLKSEKMLEQQIISILGQYTLLVTGEIGILSTLITPP